MKTQINILIVDDELIVRESLKGWLEEEGYRVDAAESAEEALSMVARTHYDIAFCDIKMPGMDGIELLKQLKKLEVSTDMVMMTAYASISNAVEAMKVGAFDYLTKPFDPDHVSLLVTKVVSRRALERENAELRGRLSTTLKHVHIIGSSPAMASVLAQVEEVAASDMSVLIEGESGTGKEMVARAIHYSSPRCFEPLVVVSCGALPEGLVESELFGYERGAFTGAFYKKTGKFEAANDGTLFLDEIGELNGKMQVDLLRVLQEKEIVRIGSNKTIKVDFRVISATNRSLKEMMLEKSFREDLYYRLNVYRIEIPPLRERMQDLEPLVDHFVAQLRRRTGKDLEGASEEAMDFLRQHSWPGNVRELENTIERSFITASNRLIQRKDLNFLEPDIATDVPLGGTTLANLERAHIQKVLEETDFNVALAARILDVDRTTVYNKMKRYGITKG